MAELLTTDEAAAYLRLSERKLYELVAHGAVPCTKATGRWLFPRAALDRWVMAGLITPAALAQPAPPPILGGSHDPLIEWALRETHCGLAYLPEGSSEGLRRLTQGEVIAAAIHLHALDAEDDEETNLAAVAAAAGLHDAVVIAFAKREQGIVTAVGNARGVADIRSLAGGGVRVAQRPAGAGAQLLLLALLRRAGVTPDRVAFVRPACPTGTDIAQAIRSGRADCGIATRSVAAIAGLEFQPLVWERFDLVLRQRDYFLPGPQALFSFLRSPALRDRAIELGGYDVDSVGEVRLVN
jgi:excisionase family DNA binding protein